MTGRRNEAAVAITVVLLVSACTGGGGATRDHEAGFDAARTSIVNPSDHRGGILRYALPGVPDSFDPGNTYSWNSARLWSRALTTYRPLPGLAGAKLVPDLATTLGRVSDGGRT